MSRRSAWPYRSTGVVSYTIASNPLPILGIVIWDGAAAGSRRAIRDVVLAAYGRGREPTTRRRSVPSGAAQPSTGPKPPLTVSARSAGTSARLANCSRQLVTNWATNPSGAVP